MSARLARTGASDVDLRRAAVIASAGAAAIHFGAAHPHLWEYRPAGLFMLLSGLAQLAWACRAAAGVSRPVLAAGAAGNLGIAGLWAVSRTVGLPVGPMPWVAEHIHATDALATALELMVAGACVALLVPTIRRPGRTLMLLAVAGAALSTILTAHDPSRERIVATAAMLLAAGAASLVGVLSTSFSLRPVTRGSAQGRVARRGPAVLDALARSASAGARG